MTGAPTIPVTVLTGFLGSGKTTVLNYLLHQPDMEGVVAIINEFGEVGLDHLLVETSEERFALLDNGCVCCSVREDLVSLLAELSSRGGVGAAPIRRVLIETTGLADPVPVLHTLMTAPSVVERYRIDGVVVTVDAVNAIGSLDAHAEAVKQIAVADRILLTKSDLVDEVSRAAVEKCVRLVNPTVSITHVEHGRIGPEHIFEAGLFSPEGRSDDVALWFAAAAKAAGSHAHGSFDDGHHEHRHDVHDKGVASFSLTVREPIRWDAFSRWLDYVAALKGDDLLRFKALVNVAERPAGPMVVHAVQHVMHPPIEMDAWPSDDRNSRLVFIVRDIPEEAIVSTLARFGDVSRDSIARTAA
ncbi:MAG: GTP-binding protein [Pseudolabrys sp.]